MSAETGLFGGVLPAQGGEPGAAGASEGKRGPGRPEGSQKRITKDRVRFLQQAHGVEPMQVLWEVMAGTSELLDGLDDMERPSCSGSITIPKIPQKQWPGATGLDAVARSPSHSAPQGAEISHSRVVAALIESQAGPGEAPQASQRPGARAAAPRGGHRFVLSAPIRPHAEDLSEGPTPSR